MKLIVGLNNNNLKYKNTRHNIGSCFVKKLAKTYKKKFKIKKMFLGKISKIKINKKNTYLLIPNTYINLSGNSVLPFIKYYKIKKKNIIIVHDELDLTPGIAKFKKGINYCGHNGIKHIAQTIKYNKFYRLRIGIGHPGKNNDINKFVLNKPEKKEKKLINNAIKKAIKSIKILIKKNIIIAMNELHNYK
ncbi:aminoacyl-tRNA hydrolase [Candidatus Purcelliella pentastirinorum]|uniref:Peptidyl-tRNA hydrolase n=1 Tax=Candidatus Purcelliella pentastirinorum TaxID=472834 RepID=A0AAX3N750_9ENTR|nr:aminoacyl-tRNA hydrolase [Candidatus Purcelliella pentastirinorum]WDI78399.1 aminoacyl-tRNA hydrolase [Candidatus Purcelliella pentastirinorum]WDR80574.1 aminoacyl-tRNA hydrolase [Candidatus Purcelliella pentastirinorum]